MSDPEFSQAGPVYRLRWPADFVAIDVGRLKERSNGLHAEVMIAQLDGEKTRLLALRTLNLHTSKSGLAKELGNRHTADWPMMLENMCFLVIEAYRKGEPIEWLDEGEPDSEEWLLHPFLEFGGPTTLFAPGGSGKSLFALAVEFTVSTGLSFLGPRPAVVGPTMYLDWETNASIHRRRVRQLARGLGSDTLPHIAYRRMTAGLSDAVDHLRTEAAELGIVMVVVDSLGLARGGEPESAEATLKLFAAIRALDLPTLCVDHVSKDSMQRSQSGHLAPFGSIYTENASRNTWSVHGPDEPEGDTLPLILRHQKCNNGKRSLPLGYELSFSDDAITLRSRDTRELPQFPKVGSLTSLVVDTLRKNRDPQGMKVAEVAEILGEKRQSVASTMTRLSQKDAVVELAGHRYTLRADREEQ